MERNIETIDDSRLADKLRDILSRWPLYREFRYNGSGFQWLPEEIKFFCEQCGKEQSWRETVPRKQRMVTADRDMGFKLRDFRCRNCKDQHLFVVYEWTSMTEERDGKKEITFLFRKCGQWPPLQERISPELEEALKGSEDLSFYKTALRLRNFGHGIGAMGYMRRVIENHMNEMLDILYEEAKSAVPESLPDIESIKTSRFADKLEHASKLFPKHLTPGGLPNPFAPLYTITSDALHNLSEEESVLLFDQCRTVFEQVFSNLRPHLRKNREFVSGLRAISEAAAKAKK